MKSNSIISVPEEVLKLLRKETERKYKVPQIGIYHPSLLVRSCLKSQWNHYVMSAREGKLPDSFLLHTSEGKIWHEKIQSIGIWDSVETPVRKRIKLNSGEWITIRGRADAVRGDTVFEFKRHNYVPRKPKFCDLLQLNFYMECLGLPKGVLATIGYTNGEFGIREDYWTLSDWHSQILVDRAISLHTFLKHNEVPHCSCRNKIHDSEYERWVREQEKKS